MNVFRDQLAVLEAHYARLRQIRHRLTVLMESVNDLRVELNQIVLETEGILTSARPDAGPRS